MRLSPKWLVLATCLILGFSPDRALPQTTSPQLHEDSPARLPEAPGFRLKLVGAQPRPDNLFTQGLLFWEGHLYESTGLRGKSAMHRYSLDASRIEVRRRLGDAYFGEGAAVLNDTLYQLTWTSGVALAYRGSMLAPSQGFEYRGQGWGLTSDGTRLWLSDGSDSIYAINDKGNVLQELKVTFKSKALDRINELEWVEGWILANRWKDTRIFVINPLTGTAVAAFDLAGIARSYVRENREHVLNGIAWNPLTRELWITGKNWNRFYRMDIELPPIYGIPDTPAETGTHRR